MKFVFHIECHVISFELAATHARSRARKDFQLVCFSWSTSFANRPALVQAFSWKDHLYSTRLNFLSVRSPVKLTVALVCTVSCRAFYGFSNLGGCSPPPPPTPRKLGGGKTKFWKNSGLSPPPPTPEKWGWGGETKLGKKQRSKNFHSLRSRHESVCCSFDHRATIGDNTKVGLVALELVSNCFSACRRLLGLLLDRVYSLKYNLMCRNHRHRSTSSLNS